MKFITEDDLRQRYRNDPFTIYDPEPGTRLTPGARQFLVDRRIEFTEGNNAKVQSVIRKSLTKEVCCPTANPNHNSEALEAAEIAEPVEAIKAVKKSENNIHKGGDWRIHMIRSKMDTIYAMFLKTEQAVLKCDVSVAKLLTELGRYYESIRRMVNGKGGNTDFAGEACELLTSVSDEMEEGPEITEFHVQLENGRLILELNELRFGLREIYPLVEMAVEANSLESVMGDDLICRINRIVNSLSYMINAALGGKDA